MPSVRTLSKLAFGGAGVILGGGQTVLGTFSQSCPNPQLSCHNTTVVENLCCFNAPGGQLLLTQFWDTDPVTGPEDSWTIHGLWPDRCDGSFEANCDPSREYTNISAIIKSFGKDDLLNDMETYWKDYKGNDDSFWSHEWGKHGTCISTMEPECYDEHKATEEVVDFFQKTVDLFKELPSYKWLEEAGITPSDSETYTTDAIQAALSAKRPGVEVTLGCKSGRLNEIWYHYDVRGPVQTGEFVPANPDGPKSSCPKSGIKYLPKNGGGSQPKPTGTKPTTGVPTSTSAPGTPFSGRGTLNVQVDGSKKGCIISAGTWYTSGTCATFTATSSDSGFTLSSSKGPCGVVGGALTCASKVPATTFTAVDGKLAAGGNAAWSSNKVASGTTQQKVYAGADHDTGFEIVWG
ncbi:ribonuclease T2 [Aaosphaeria arxii CBS 175.79]|uniref:Ribonuclease T2-like n=1 Tax=Aaosphaeria arxii CBS 175.79 TaxID=1450172 RepID=A0A6A5XEN3_9PLEO|nr:ribonuclease T2 [Aaosphaeria arxii CBS 175.79]KAF2011685.1 ribonuclease T2 [Aaosphaeria arxii CBS 175.79]